MSRLWRVQHSCVDPPDPQNWAPPKPAQRPIICYPRAYHHQPGGISIVVKRGVIVAKIKPGAEAKVAEIFAESDATELPGLAGVRHRSLFILDDVYVHLVEMDEDFSESVSNVRD